MKTLLYFWNVFLIISTTNSSFSDYINGIRDYLGFYQKTEDDSTYLVYNRKIPYEVSTVDEKFISEAAKLTGIALSELDSCQYRVNFNVFSLLQFYNFQARMWWICPCTNL